MQKNSQNFSMEEIKRLANSPAGQQLIAMLQSTNSPQLQVAVELANRGDLKAAGQALSGLLSSEQAQKLMDELRR